MNYFLFFLLVVFVPELKVVRGVYWPCESINDCFAEGSECFAESGLCKCRDFESVFSEDFSKCLKTSRFGDKCQETRQCNLMPTGATCEAGVCECVEGQTYVRGRCRPLKWLGESCDTDIDCYFGYDRQSVSCKNHTCECADGYYQRYENICRRKSMEIGDACVVNTDCSELGERVRCVRFACQSIEETTTDTSSAGTTAWTKTVTSAALETTFNQSKPEYGKHAPAVGNDRSDFTGTELQAEKQPESIAREIAVQTSTESLELNAATLRFKDAATATELANGELGRLSYVRRHQTALRSVDEDNKTLSTVSNIDDESDDRKYGSPCTDNGRACPGLPHSICSSNICLCKQGYYNKDHRCLAELGEVAESAGECEFRFDELSHLCLCQKGFYYEPNLRGCKKPISFRLSCTSNSQCSPFGAVFCSPEVPRRCTCAEYAQYDELQQLCAYKQGLGARCENNAGCPVRNSVCSNGSCVCKRNFIEQEDACVAGVGAACDEDAECQPENSVCEEFGANETEEGRGSCQCRRGFVHFRDECLKEAEDIEDACVESEQCRPLLGTCIDKKCSCSVHQHFKNGRCVDKKGLGEACSKASECFAKKDPENVECRNSICQCRFGYQAEQGTCSRVAFSKKNSSGRPSALKIITFALIGAAFLITSAAIKQAYY